MIRKDILLALALGSSFGCATALAQNDPGASAPATAPTAPAAQTSGDDVIHLHLPVHHRARHAHAGTKPAEQAAPSEAATVDSIGADAAALPPVAAPVAASANASPSPKAAPPAKPAKSPEAPAKNSAPTIPFSFGEDSGAPPEASGPTGGLKSQAAVTTHEKKTASLPPRPESPKATPVPARPVREAATSTKANEHTGLAKRGAVLFDKGVSNPSPQQFDGLKLLAGDLSTAVEAGRGPVQLEAYAGTRGDKSSDARRLSLKRAIAVRQLLIDNGVPSSRIIVRAMGGADDTGPNDRVDVFVRAS